MCIHLPFSYLALTFVPTDPDNGGFPLGADLRYKAPHGNSHHEINEIGTT